MKKIETQETRKLIYKGYSFPVKPAIAGEHIDKLTQEHDGEITPDIVVADARDKNSPIHPCFEWDNKTAADEHRKHQARVLMASITIEVKKVDGSKITVPKFVNIRIDKDNTFTRSNLHTVKSSYVTIETAMSNENIRSHVIQKAIAEMMLLKNKYEHLDEFSKIWAAMEDVAA